MALIPMTVARLKVVRTAEFGAFLDAETGDSKDDILLHKNQQTETIHIGEYVNVLLYLDPKRKMAASMRVPKIREGETAQLKIINTTKDGAFVDAGAERGIFLPFAEMLGRPKPGDLVRVKLYTDKSGRLAVSMKAALHRGEQVDGTKEEEIARDAARILKYLHRKGGFVSEQLPPTFIQANFRISKAAFKRAIGYLFKRRLIEKSGNGFKLVGEGAQHDDA